MLLLAALASAEATAADARMTTAGWEEFVRGDFVAAQEKGRASATADGYALACRSGLVRGGFLETGAAAVSHLHSAATDCANALRITPDHYSARMSLSIALSFEGKRLRRVAYPKKAKMLIESLITTQPDNPLGYGALAAWHSEVSAAGFLARMVLGARRKTSRGLFHKAQKMGAIDFPLQFEYVKFLARGNKSDRAKALVLADTLIKQVPAMAIDRIIQEKCSLLLGALRTNKKKSILEALKQASAFYSIENAAHLDAYSIEGLPGLAETGD